MIETSLIETLQNITSEEQKKKVEKLKLVCKILEQEDNPHSKDKKQGEILTEEERKHKENDKKFIKELEEGKKLKQKAKKMKNIRRR